ncbi:MAG: hypothetical protein ACYC05_09405 [Sulfuricella sp.]
MSENTVPRTPTPVVSHIETGGQSRHSGESRNPEKSTTWTPAFAGVTVQLIHAFHRD